MGEETQKLAIAIAIVTSKYFPVQKEKRGVRTADLEKDDGSDCPTRTALSDLDSYGMSPV